MSSLGTQHDAQVPDSFRAPDSQGGIPYTQPSPGAGTPQQPPPDSQGVVVGSDAEASGRENRGAAEDRIALQLAVGESQRTPQQPPETPGFSLSETQQRILADTQQTNDSLQLAINTPVVGVADAVQRIGAAVEGAAPAPAPGLPKAAPGQPKAAPAEAVANAAEVPKAAPGQPEAAPAQAAAKAKALVRKAARRQMPQSGTPQYNRLMNMFIRRAEDPRQN